MTRKKNKKQKQQKIQQRRAKVAQKRSDRRVSAIPPSPADTNQPFVGSIAAYELMQDIQVILPDSKKREVNVQEMLQIVLETDKLKDEPEFEEFIFHPSDCLEIFIATTEEMGLGPELLNVSVEDAAVQIQQHQVIDKSLAMLLTDEIRQTIVEKLKQLRQRARAEKLKKLAGQAAMVQSILQDEQYRELYTSIGLLNALFLESVEIGFELMMILSSNMATDKEESSDALLIQQQLGKPESFQRIKNLLARYPKLENYLGFQAYEMWETTLTDLYNGELYLELFTDSELEQIYPLYESMFVELEQSSVEEVSDKREILSRFLNKANENLDELLTPERIAQLKQDMQRQDLSDKLPPDKLPSFLILQEFVTDAETTAEELRPTALKILLGELGVKYSITVQES